VVAVILRCPKAGVPTAYEAVAGCRIGLRKNRRTDKTQRSGVTVLWGENSGDGDGDGDGEAVVRRSTREVAHA
jgi:hypothetical protein